MVTLAAWAGIPAAATPPIAIIAAINKLFIIILLVQGWRNAEGRSVVPRGSTWFAASASVDEMRKTSKRRLWKPAGRKMMVWLTG
jgi:hypothetical protein